MKKTVIFILAVIFARTSIFAQKQWHVGDLVMDYEIPAVVVYVDDTGEHGLLLGLHKYPQTIYDFKEYYMSQNMIERYTSGEIPWFNPLNEQKRIYKNYKKQLFSSQFAVASCGLTKGQEIAAFIDKYCTSNNLEKSVFFWTHYWAEKLGDGWFLPGDAELELMSPAITGHSIGEEFQAEYKGNALFVRNYLSDVFAGSFAQRIFEQWNSEDKTQKKFFGENVDCVRGLYFSPCIESSNLSVYKNKVAHHSLVVRGTKLTANKQCKALIDYGIIEIDKKEFGEFGKFICRPAAFPFNHPDWHSKDFGYAVGGSFLFSFTYEKLYDSQAIVKPSYLCLPKVSILPVKYF